MLDTTTTNEAKEEISPEYWRLGDVMVALSLSRATIYKLIKEGGFPPPIKLSPKLALFPVADIRSWVESHRVPKTNRLAGHHYA